MYFVVLGNTHRIPIHEGLGGGEEDTHIGTDLAGLGHACRQVTGQEGGLVDLGGVAADIGLSQVVHVNNGELLIRVGIRSRTRRIRQQEADRNDQVATRFDEGVHVDFIVGSLLELKISNFHTQFGLGAFKPNQPVALKDLSSIPPVSVTSQALKALGVRTVATDPSMMPGINPSTSAHRSAGTLEAQAEPSCRPTPSFSRVKL